MRAALAVLCLALAACATPPAPCPPGLTPARAAQLFFGRNIGAKLAVSEADWARFAAEEIAPRFPAGFTLRDGAGRYRDKAGALIEEPSKEAMILLTGDPDEPAKLAAVRAAYKHRFAQESVLLIESAVCAAF